MIHCPGCYGYIDGNAELPCGGCGHEAELTELKETIAIQNALLTKANKALALLREEREYVATIKASIVDTVGGVDDEGNPTSELNYLQRLRQLVKKEKELALLREVAEAAQNLQQEPWYSGRRMNLAKADLDDALAAWEKTR